MAQLDRITQDGGKACIRGMRVAVGITVGQIGAGHRRVNELHVINPVICSDLLLGLRSISLRCNSAEYRSTPREIVNL